MSLLLLFIDEIKGFYKSKVMVVLWIGVPLLSILFHYLQPDTEGIPLASLVALLVSSIGGILGSVMLSTSIVNEKKRGVYDLFLIRPVKRWNIILAKFFAVYICLIIAVFISLIAGFLVDYFTIDIPLETIMKDTLESVAISFNAMAISCSIGVLIGILTNSVALAAILAIYVGNQLSSISVLPSIFIKDLNPVIFASVVGISITITVLTINILIFNKKQF
ncbi:MAG: ABC transporter permease [Candidatus Helarchaeota archaeon]